MKLRHCRISGIVITILSFICSIGTMDIHACTAAVISAEASASGRPMLWKHRDTSNTDNKVEYVPSQDGSLAYVALFNAQDTKLEEAWAGMNEAGFAIMNTASYNIKDDKVPDKMMDKEGYVMTLALKSCHTINDFQHLLDTLPRPMGVEANFGVIDSSGQGAVFETNNHSYKRYNTSDTPGGTIIRTNYSHSGRTGEGYGYVREANARFLLQPHIDNHDITPAFLTETVSRSFYHDIHQCDDINTGQQWLIDLDYIPRYKSTATIVIEGIPPQADNEYSTSDIINQYIMWTGLGYPPCAEIVPVWCHPCGVADGLRGISDEGRSELCDIAKQRRAEVFSMRNGKDNNYIRVEKLTNPDGTGYLQTLVPHNLETYRIISNKRDNGLIKFQ